MAENKFVVKTVFHDENGDTLLREDYRETREKAQKLNSSAKVKQKSQLKLLSANTNHHFL